MEPLHECVWKEGRGLYLGPLAHHAPTFSCLGNSCIPCRLLPLVFLVPAPCFWLTAHPPLPPPRPLTALYLTSLALLPSHTSHWLLSEHPVCPGPCDGNLETCDPTPLLFLGRLLLSHILLPGVNPKPPTFLSRLFQTVTLSPSQGGPFSPLGLMPPDSPAFSFYHDSSMAPSSLSLLPLAKACHH